MSLEDLNTDDGGCDCEGGAPAWMATFSDMATLLLTFFVLLLSFANMDVENFRMALGSVKEALGVQMEVEGNFEGRASTPVDPMIQLSPTPTTQKDRLMAEQVMRMKRLVQRRGLGKLIDVAGTPRGIVLRIKELVLFHSGSDELMDEASRILRLVGELFETFDGHLIIEGHTDDRPINSPRFPSNWELSTARSTAVLRFFIEEQKLDVSRLGVAGYADSRPVASNATAAGRAKNRRVDFLFQTNVTDDPSRKSKRSQRDRPSKRDTKKDSRKPGDSNKESRKPGDANKESRKPGDSKKSPNESAPPKAAQPER